MTPMWLGAIQLIHRITVSSPSPHRIHCYGKETIANWWITASQTLPLPFATLPPLLPLTIFHARLNKTWIRYLMRISMRYNNTTVSINDTKTNLWYRTIQWHPNRTTRQNQNSFSPMTMRRIVYLLSMIGIFQLQIAVCRQRRPKPWLPLPFPCRVVEQCF